MTMDSGKLGILQTKSLMIFRNCDSIIWRICSKPSLIQRPSKSVSDSLLNCVCCVWIQLLHLFLTFPKNYITFSHKVLT